MMIYIVQCTCKNAEESYTDSFVDAFKNKNDAKKCADSLNKEWGYGIEKINEDKLGNTEVILTDDAWTYDDYTYYTIKVTNLK